MSNPVKIMKRADVELDQMKLQLMNQANAMRDNNIVSHETDGDYTDFETACEKFRGVCNEIRNLLGVEYFFGSYDEIELYRTRAELKTEEGMDLKEQLNLYNSECIHEGNKIGLPPPQWFKKCWGME